MIAKIIATIKTRWQQARCAHGPWIKDRYKTNGLRTCHCQVCWKVQFEDTFAYHLARNETYDEWILRATKGGMSLDEATRFWEENLRFD